MYKAAQSFQDSGEIILSLLIIGRDFKGVVCIDIVPISALALEKIVITLINTEINWVKTKLFKWLGIFLNKISIRGVFI